MLSQSELVQIIKSHQWNIQGFNGTPLYLHPAASLSGWMHEPVFANYTHFFYLFSGGHARMYYDQSDWQKIGESYYERVNNLEKLLELEKGSQALFDAKFKNAQDLLGVISDNKISSLARSARAVAAVMPFAANYGHALEGITFVSEIRLRELLQARKVYNELDFSILCSPLYPSFIFRALQLLFRLRSGGPEQQSLLDQFKEQFYWIENNYTGAKNFTDAEILARSEAITVEPVNALVAPEVKELLMAKLRLGTEERFIIQTIETSFRWQDERKKNIFQVISLLDTVLEPLAGAAGWSLPELRYCLPEELTPERLADESFHASVKERLAGSAWYALPNETTIFAGDAYWQIVQALQVPVIAPQSELKGIIASKGRVEGVVRVCRTVSDIATVANGEILVASMTRPEFLPAMQRAAGFITDEGGLTCHAAIISREMGKPCIIGTKIATEVLQSGDRVLLDAETGRVHVL